MAGWLGIGAVALAYDIFAIRTKRCETLSCVAGRHPLITASVLAGLGLHFNSHRFKRS